MSFTCLLSASLSAILCKPSSVEAVHVRARALGEASRRCLLPFLRLSPRFLQGPPLCSFGLTFLVLELLKEPWGHARPCSRGTHQNDQAVIQPQVRVDRILLTLYMHFPRKNCTFRLSTNAKVTQQFPALQPVEASGMLTVNPKKHQFGRNSRFIQFPEFPCLQAPGKDTWCLWFHGFFRIPSWAHKAPLNPSPSL